MDLIIRRANVLGQEELVDIGIKDGIIRAIKPTFTNPSANEIDAAGRFVSPGLIEQHAHLDKSLTRHWASEPGVTLDDQIRQGREFKSKMTVEDIVQRASTVIKKYVANGTTAIRTCVEVDSVIGDQAVIAMEQLKSKFKSTIDIQTVAFPQEGWFHTPGTLELGCEDYVKKAMQTGMDAVGGNVNAGIWPSDPKQQLDRIFSIAREFNAFIDLHLDNYDSSVAFSLPYLCEKTIEYKYQGLVTVAHAIGIAHVDSQTRRQVIEQAKEADVNIAVMPNRIRLTSVKEFMDAGVNVVIGSDGFKDAFVYISNANVLHNMLLLAHLLSVKNVTELATIFYMGTINAAKSMGITGYGIAEGNKADIVIFDATTLEEVIMEVPYCSYVFKGGQIVAESGKFIERT